MKILPIFIPNAGCPGDCVFCDQSINSGVAHPPSLEDVEGLLAATLKKNRLDQVAFFGGSFTALPGALQDGYLATVRPYIESGTVSGIRISTRPDCIDPDCVDRLCNSGVETVELGCQSFSNDVLLASGRGCGADVHAEAVALLRGAGLSVGIQLMPGLPGSTEEEACASLREALKLEPDFLRIYPTLVLSGTRLEALWREGSYLPLSLDRAVDLCADMAHICHLAGVPVLRFGLQASKDLDSGAVLAGPYHPAFGQLVQSRLWLRALRGVSADDSEPSVKVHPHDLSDALGQRRSNFNQLRQHCPGFLIEASDQVPRGQLKSRKQTGDMMALAAGSR